MLWGHIFAIISLVYKYSAQQGNESMLEVRVEKMLVGYVVVVLASRFFGSFFENAVPGFSR